MTSQLTELEAPTRLLPLLRSIGEEIVERAEALAELESTVRTLSPRHHETDIVRLQASIAEHKRELRYAQRELERLDCTIADVRPLTFKIGSDENAELTWILGSDDFRQAG